MSNIACTPAPQRREIPGVTPAISQILMDPSITTTDHRTKHCYEQYPKNANNQKGYQKRLHMLPSQRTGETELLINTLF